MMFGLYKINSMQIKKYGKIRFDEFIERKRMKMEERINSIILVNEEAKQISKETIEEKIP